MFSPRTHVFYLSTHVVLYFAKIMDSLYFLVSRSCLLRTAIDLFRRRFFFSPITVSKSQSMQYIVSTFAPSTQVRPARPRNVRADSNRPCVDLRDHGFCPSAPLMQCSHILSPRTTFELRSTTASDLVLCSVRGTACDLGTTLDTTCSISALHRGLLSKELCD